MADLNTGTISPAEAKKAIAKKAKETVEATGGAIVTDEDGSQWVESESHGLKMRTRVA